MISEKDKERVLDACNIEDVIGEFVELKKEGSRYKCCCPIHNERTPSFVVTPSRNMFKCFGCGIGGNAITFLMEAQHMTYPEAVKHIAKRYNITIEEEEQPQTAEEREARLKIEAMRIANNKAALFFAAQLNVDTDKARQAKQYAERRWGKRFIQQESIGYAPGNGAIIHWANQEGLSTDLLKELGLIKDKEGRLLDGYFDRVTIPIRDRYGNVIGFTARSLNDNGPKYINSPESMIYNKSNSLFGIHNALRQGAREELFYIVEGAPDVMKLQSLDVNNTLAPLGTALTENQLKQLKRFNPRLCFIPDIDPPKEGEQYGTGIAAVMKNGLAAIEAGYSVSVKEIVPKNKTEKADPGSYIDSKAILEAIEEEDFVIWYASKLSLGKKTGDEKAVIIKSIAKILAGINDRVRIDMYIKPLSKIFDLTKTGWQNVINEAKKERTDSKKERGRTLLEYEFRMKYHFDMPNNCCIGYDKDNHPIEWSNFTLEPLFHIKDQVNPKRLFRIKNVFNQEEIIELKQEDLGSLQRFRNRVEGMGNYIWKGKEEHLILLKTYLYEFTETAVEITQLGWQNDGFFAFGNGIFHHGAWLPADEYGIVRIDEIGNFYLPATSLIYKKESSLFQFERQFIHTNLSQISFRKYTDKLIQVFGDNAKIGISFLLASLFKDVVTSVTGNFPILNLFGIKGSGKSEFGQRLMAFFIIGNKPVNIMNATDAAIAESVAQSANALVHIDEYKNSIELSRREIIKGWYDGVGRTRLNMDRDKKRETTAVKCGVILSGQEMPTIDIAIFSRLLFCHFNRTEFSPEERRNFDELKQMGDMGCSHLTLELLKHRKKVEAEFSSNYRDALADIMEAAANDSIEDRILRNWVIPLAAFRTLAGVIDVGFSYKEMLSICVDSMRRQNSECRSSNELAGFWQVVDFLHQNGELFIDADYRIKRETEFRGKGMAHRMVFKTSKPILYLCTKRVMMLYKKNGKTVGDTTLPIESLRYYLENSKEYIGTKNAVRFKNFVNAAESHQSVTSPTGIQSVEKTSRIDWALCFDYEMLAENYQINLEVEVSYNDDPEPDELDTEDDTFPYN